MYANLALRFPKLKQNAVLLFTLFMAVTFTYGGFFAVTYYEQQKSIYAIEKMFRDKVTSLSQVTSNIDKVFLSTASLLKVKPNLSKEDFATLINTSFLQHSGLQGVHWAPAVQKSQQKQFQQTVRNSGLFDYRVYRDKPTRSCENSFNENFFPILYALPEQQNGQFRGFDLVSNCTIRQVMYQSLRENRISYTEFTDENNDVGLRLIMAVHDNENRLAGFISGLIMLNQLIDALVADWSLSEDSQLNIYDSREAHTKLYSSSSQIYCTENCEQKPIVHQITADIPFVNQTWSVEFLQFDAKRKNYNAYAVCSLIVGFFVLLIIYLRMNIYRVDWANSLVDQRTASLHHQANHDDLTQLQNKHALLNKIEELKREEADTTIIFMDLDEFKKINDTMGHQVGDQLLKLVAARLSSVIEDDGDIYRFAGDEFVVILNKCFEKESIMRIADKLLYKLQQPYDIDGMQNHVGVSIGIAINSGEQSDDVDIIRDADIAMYESKRRGKNQITLYQKGMLDTLIEDQFLERGLRDALKQDQISMFLQPIISKEGKLKGFEALSRWKHPERGYIPPSIFIEIAEENGLIHELGEWLLSQVCQVLSHWLKDRHVKECPYISINLSAHQLNDDTFTHKIASMLSEHSIPANLLAIELTESAIIRNNSFVKKQLEGLKQIGVIIMLDDFGTGYSSLSLLQNFPIDIIKIDKSFIFGTAKGDNDSQQLTKAIVNMANAMDMLTIAEGVEDEQTSIWLQKNCETDMQGYYFCPPICVEEAQALLIEQFSSNGNYAVVSSTKTDHYLKH